MKILVCLKQVPSLHHVRFDRANRIVRDGVPSLCNPSDKAALEHALVLKNSKANGLLHESIEAVAITMGPPNARNVLVDAINQGIDRAIHLSDRRFKGADTLATARALAEIVRHELPDLVLVGRSTLDGATAQLGPQLAELVGLPLLTEAVELAVQDKYLVVKRETTYCDEAWRAKPPAVVTVMRGPLLAQSSNPDPNTGLDNDRIVEVTADDLEGETTSYGTRGSPTFVREVRPRDVQRRGKRVTDVDKGAAEIARRLNLNGTDTSTAWPESDQGACDVWVLVEQDYEGLDPITFDLLAAGRELASELDATLTAVLFATHDEYATNLTKGGADRVLHVRTPHQNPCATTTRTSALVQALTAAADGLLERSAPLVVVAPWSAEGRDYVPRAAARLGLGLVGDVTGIEVEVGENPRVGWVKPSWGGTADALVISRKTPTIATLRPGTYPHLKRRNDVATNIETFAPELPDSDATLERLAKERIVPNCLVDRASVVFLIGEDTPISVVKKLYMIAERGSVGVGGTSEAVRAGLIPSQWELSILKRSITPRTCVAFGVRSSEDIAPVQGAHMLISVHPEGAASGSTQFDLRIETDIAPVVQVLEREFAS